jgi:nucleoside phosphorylase
VYDGLVDYRVNNGREEVRVLWPRNSTGAGKRVPQGRSGQGKEKAGACKNRGMLDERHHPLQQDPSDDNNYTLGCIGVHNVVLACLPYGVTGLTSAATVAMQMRSSFKWLRFGLMVGIGGSRDNDIRLRDVVVSKPTGRKSPLG